MNERTKKLRLSGVFYFFALALLLLKQVLLGLTPLILNIMIDAAVLGRQVGGGVLFGVLSRFVSIEEGFNSILILSLIMLAFSLIAAGLSYFSDFLRSIATETIVSDLRERLHMSIQRFTYAHYTKEESGELLQRCTSNVATIKQTLSQFLIQGITIIFLICYIFAIMLSQNVKMTLFSFFILPVIFIFSMFFFSKIKKAEELSYKKEAYITGILNDNLHGVRVVKAFSMQNYEKEKFEKASLEYYKTDLKLTNLNAVFWGVNNTITSTQFLFVVLYGSYLAFLGEMTVGQVSAFCQYVVMLVSVVRSLGMTISNMGRFYVSIKRVREILNGPKENIDQKQVLPFHRGSLAFKNVSFTYPSSEKKVLDDVSFEAREGQMLGIMGMTGSGKTTLMYLLEHLYDCGEGKIEIGGVDIAGMELHELRQHVSIVLQEPFLYSKTIKENIKEACPFATDEEVIEVSKKACLHKDVMEMEAGYETIVGENGITLSGGQKQRLAIARTLLRDSPIIVFDDSLSSVDVATDAQIRAGIAQIRKDKILIVISHRISSIMEADKIIVMDGGRVVQEGVHKDLILQEGVYKRVYDLQNSI